MNSAPVILLAHSSNRVRFLNAFPIQFAPREITIARRTTGSAVPMPYNNGRITADPVLTASGTKLPKKSAAEVGQNERAKTTPRRPAPQIPNRSALLRTFSLTPDPEVLKGFRARVGKENVWLAKNAA